MSMEFSEISTYVGHVGVLMVLIAYYLLQNKTWTSYDANYSVMNLVGSIFILYSLFYHWNTPSVVIEIAWIGISIIGLVKCKKRKYQPT